MVLKHECDFTLCDWVVKTEAKQYIILALTYNIIRCTSGRTVRIRMFLHYSNRRHFITSDRPDPIQY